MNLKTEKSVLIFAKAITPDAGGIETYSEQVALAYAKLGFDVNVISCFQGERGVSQRGPVKIVNVGSGRQLAVAFRMIISAIRFRMRSSRPTLIHATTWRVALPALIVFCRVPLVITVHGREVTEMPWHTGPLMRLVFHLASTAVVISHSTLAIAAQRVPALQRKSVVSWNGITGSSEHSYQGAAKKRSANDVCRILTICRLVPRKNVAAVVYALSRLNDEGCSNWQYSIIGEGPEYESIENARDQCGLSKMVHLHGRVSDRELFDQYSNANIFVHPQVSGDTGLDIEGFGLAIADAMAWGLPVIVGRDGAPKEYVSDGVTGYVVDGASVTEIATTIKLLIEDRDSRKTVGAAARSWVVGNLDWTKHVSRVLEHPALAEVLKADTQRLL